MVPRRRAVSLTEAIEDIRQKLRLDAAAGIGNANLERASGHARRHHDVAARGRELERVAEEVDKHLLEALDVATKRRLGNGRQLNVDLTPGRERADRLDDAANQVRRVDGVEIERPASAVHLRKIEQVVHEFGLPRGIPVNRFDSLRQHFGIHRIGTQHRSPAENGIQRGPQLVRNRRYELVLQPIGALGVRSRTLGLLVEPGAIQCLGSAGQPTPAAFGTRRRSSRAR